MTKAKRMMQEDIKLIDIVIELLDARAPLSSKNPDIDNLAANKSRMVILNKADMADARKTAKWEEYFKAKGFFVLSMDSRKNSGMKPVSDTIREACKEKIARDRKRGIINRPIRAMIVGIPNVGKSTFINSYAKKSCTKVGNKPGVTKGKQWIRIGKDVELSDYDKKNEFDVEAYMRHRMEVKLTRTQEFDLYEFSEESLAGELNTENKEAEHVKDSDT